MYKAKFSNQTHQRESNGGPFYFAVIQFIELGFLIFESLSQNKHGATLIWLLVKLPQLTK